VKHSFGIVMQSFLHCCASVEPGDEPQRTASSSQSDVQLRGPPSVPPLLEPPVLEPPVPVPPESVPELPAVPPLPFVPPRLGGCSPGGGGATSP
jgi:hypothetical protein